MLPSVSYNLTILSVEPDKPESNGYNSSKIIDTMCYFSTQQKCAKMTFKGEKKHFYERYLLYWGIRNFQDTKCLHHRLWVWQCWSL